MQATQKSSVTNESHGILTIAHTKNKYIRQAINLAISIRIHSPEIPIAIATNLESKDFQKFGKLFDHIIQWDFSETPGLIAKLSIYEMTPFQETLFIDADCLVLKPLETIFEYLDDEEFSVFGINCNVNRESGWFQNMEKIKNEINSETYPGFNGGIYYF